MYSGPNIRNCFIALVAAFGLLVGGVVVATQVNPVEAKSSLENGCEEFNQTDNIVIYRCYDDKTNMLFYTNSLGFISKPDN